MPFSEGSYSRLEAYGCLTFQKDVRVLAVLLLAISEKQHGENADILAILGSLTSHADTSSR